MAKMNAESLRNKRFLFSELVIISGLILIVLWIPPFILSPEQAANLGWLKWAMKQCPDGFYSCRIIEKIVFGLLGIFVLFRLTAEKRDWREAGLTLKHFLPAIKNLAVPTFGGVAALLAIGAAVHSLDLGTDRFWKKLYPNTFLGQYAQQAVIQIYFNHRAMQIFGKGARSVAWVTGTFALFHLPNPALTLGVAYGMWFWARTYQQAPNILALACSHMILTAFLWHTIPEAWRPSLTVGWRFIERAHWF